MKESEERFRNLVSNATAAIVVLRGEEMIVEVINQAYAKLVGLRREDLLGKPLFDVIPQVYDYYFPLLNGVRLTGEPMILNESPYSVIANGVKVEGFVHAAYEPYRDSTGAIIGVMAIHQDVTPHVRVRKALEESESRFRLMANAIPEVIWVADNNGNSEFFNKRWEEFCGEPFERTNAAEVAVKYLHPDDAPAVMAAFSHAIQTGQPFEVEQRNRSASGEYRWFLNRAVPYRNPASGEVEKWFGIGVDIHERKLVQDALKESQTNLSFAIDATELGTWEVDPTTNTYSGNWRFKEWFGLPPDDDMPLSLAIKSIALSDLDRVKAAMETALKHESGGKYDITYSVISQTTRKERIVRAKGKISFTKEKIAYRFDGTMQDVTEQVLSRNRLEESEARFRNVIEEATVGTALFEGPRYQLTLVNDHMLQLWQRGRSIVGQELLAFMPELEGQPFPAFLKKVYETGAMHSETDALVQLMRNGKMETVYMDYSYKAIRNIQGNVYAILVSAADVTERFLAKRKLEESEDRFRNLSETLEEEVDVRTSELKQSNEDLQRFAHVASHDLKEPVRKIKTFAGRLQDELGAKLDEKSRVYLQKIQHSTDRMVAMIDGVLAYSSINDEPLQKYEKVDLNEIVENIKNDLELIISDKHIEISSADLPAIEGAPVLLYQLFYNLINNSIKFSTEDKTPKVEIFAQPMKGGKEPVVCIIVKDNGIGFEQKFADAIFDTFTRLNSKDRYEGTGLGLALCKKIVERHHGTIQASGEKGKGASFAIILPVHQSSTKA